MTAPPVFEHLVRDYQDMVYTTAYRLLGNESDAQDVAQEVFLRAYRHFDKIRGSETQGGWLKTVTRNLCLNHLSRYRKRWSTFTDRFTRRSDEGEEDWVLPEDETSSIDRDSLDRLELVEEALAKLPQKQRVPLVLYHFEELSYEEIATQLKVSLSKVKTDISRGRQALKVVLARTMEEEG